MQKKAPIRSSGFETQVAVASSRSDCANLRLEATAAVFDRGSRKMQFKLIDLLWVTAYLAVGAWLYSSGYALFIAIWFGTVFGFEIGKRSDYSTPLLAICGTVLGLAISVAIMCSSTFTHSKIFMFGRIDVLQFLLSAAAWLTALGIFVWLVTRLKKSPVRRA